MLFQLKAVPPFSFEATVLSHGWSQLAPLEYNPSEKSLLLPLQMSSGRMTLLSLTGTRQGLTGTSSVQPDDQEMDGLAKRLEWMFALDTDLRDFHRMAAGEPGLADVQEKAKGRILRSPTFFEDVIKTILTTNTLWGATRRMVMNLVNQFGSPADGQPERRAFPLPESIAASSEAALREHCRFGYRAPYIHELARRVSSGALDLESFIGSPKETSELRRELLQIKGIGNYAAANLLMLLGRYDYIPVDSWAIKVVSHEWYEGRPIGAAEVERAFEKWGPWKGLAYYFWDWSYLKQ